MYHVAAKIGASWGRSAPAVMPASIPVPAWTASSGVQRSPSACACSPAGTPRSAHAAGQSSSGAAASTAPTVPAAGLAAVAPLVGLVQPLVAWADEAAVSSEAAGTAAMEAVGASTAGGTFGSAETLLLVTPIAAYGLFNIYRSRCAPCPLPRAPSAGALPGRLLHKHAARARLATAAMLTSPASALCPARFRVNPKASIGDLFYIIAAVSALGRAWCSSRLGRVLDPRAAPTWPARPAGRRVCQPGQHRAVQHALLLSVRFGERAGEGARGRLARGGLWHAGTCWRDALRSKSLGHVPWQQQQQQQQEQV